MSIDAPAIIRARRQLASGVRPAQRKTAEGGCGVIGIIGTEPIPGRLIIRSCEQMHNRGNGKGGGVAAVGLFDDRKDDYALHIAYLDESARGELERDFILSQFDVAHAERQQSLDDHRPLGLEIRPPVVWRYFARPRADRLTEFSEKNGIEDRLAAEDEFVYQNSFRLNSAYYVRSDPPRAFVLSHGRNLMILKAVGYAEQVARYYRLEEEKAHVWIGHQRYPTRGRVWHPGGAHPFVGLNEALVHNGDFANYYAVTEYLRQRGMVPLFVTDTEVSALLFDFYARVLGYPLEFLIEALAPTPDGDFERLSKQKQRIYRAIQTAHIHGSPDGPWFFIVARTEPGTGLPQLIGITDVSMLRPQVFALQIGERSFGAIASEKQAIDAFFEELSSVYPDVPAVADRYWNARGGSCTDGGAFVYSLKRQGGGLALDVRDKFGSDVARPLIKSAASGTGATTGPLKHFEVGPARMSGLNPAGNTGCPVPDREANDGPTPGGEASLVAELPTTAGLLADLRQGRFADFSRGIEQILKDGGPGAWRMALDTLTLLRDRRWEPASERRARLLAVIDRAINEVLDSLPAPDMTDKKRAARLDSSRAWQQPIPRPLSPDCVLAVDARGFSPDGKEAVSRVLVEAFRKGWRQLIVYRARGDRFLGCGLGPKTDGVRLDVYGSSGDYLGSGLDGALIFVHGDAQDQVGQILKSGMIAIFGSVGQTFLYGAKGGEAYVMGSAAGRPLINAVGHIRAVINGTCLDYCAESFMAGESLGGGFVIINGLAFDERGQVIGLDMKYPGNNLFSLASGGACYLNDPYGTVAETQLNGASFVPFKQADWNIILPYLEKNESLFGISIRHDLLTVDGVLKWPKEVFRKIVASAETHKLDWSSLPD
jgi:glutamate synthase domain-containing protein 1/glutamate synthase domain-containing protein 3